MRAWHIKPSNCYLSQHCYFDYSFSTGRLCWISSVLLATVPEADKCLRRQFCVAKAAVKQKQIELRA